MFAPLKLPVNTLRKESRSRLVYTTSAGGGERRLLRRAAAVFVSALLSLEVATCI